MFWGHFRGMLNITTLELGAFKSRTSRSEWERSATRTGYSRLNDPVVSQDTRTSLNGI